MEEKSVINARIVEFARCENLKMVEISRLLDITPQSLNYKLSGRNTMDADTIAQILTLFPNLSARWVMLGIGSMHTDGSDPRENETEKERIIAAMQLTIDTQRTAIELLQQKLKGYESR